MPIDDGEFEISAEAAEFLMKCCRAAEREYLRCRRANLPEDFALESAKRMHASLGGRK